MSKLTEDIVADALWLWREKCGHLTACPRFKLGGAYESDFLSVRKAMTYDHEIKLSRADYRNEFTKHSKKFKHELLRSASHGACAPNDLRFVPNYYTFVIPRGLLQAGDKVFKYAGVIEFEYGGNKIIDFRISKRPPLIHSNLIGQREFASLSRALSFRLFNARKRIINVTA